MKTLRNLALCVAAATCVLMFGRISDTAVDTVAGSSAPAGFTQLSVRDDSRVIPFARKAVPIEVEITNNHDVEIEYRWTATYSAGTFRAADGVEIGSGSVVIAAGATGTVTAPAPSTAGWVRFTLDGTAQALQWRVGP